MKKNIFLIILMLCFIIGSEYKSTCITNGTSERIKNSPSLYPAYIMKGSIKRWGYIDEHGAFIIKPVYTEAEPFMSNGLAIITTKKGVGLINGKGKAISRSDYGMVDNFEDGVAVARCYNVVGAESDYILNEDGKKRFKLAGDISRFSEGLAAFSTDIGDDKGLYGYTDKNGRVVIKPRYKKAGLFSEGKAAVRLDEKYYGIIDKKGRVIRKLSCDYINEPTEGTLCFSQKDAKGYEKYGFLSINGDIIIKPVFLKEASFKNGFAIVINDIGKYGLINKKGKFVIPPKYGIIYDAGNRFYSVTKYIDYDLERDLLSNSALFNSTGKQLTSFAYNTMNSIGDHQIAVTDDRNTYIINDRGKDSGLLKAFSGNGTIEKIGSMYVVKIFDELSYYDSRGKEVWKANNTIDLANNIKVKENYYHPKLNMLIRYPELNGFSNRKIQSMINNKLKQDIIGITQADDEEEDILKTYCINGEYKVNRNENLLIIDYSCFNEPTSAGREFSDRAVFHINLRNGRLYCIDNLFTKGSNYRTILKDKLTRIIEKQQAENEDSDPQLSYPDIDVDNDLDISNFILTRDSICIFNSLHYPDNGWEFSIPYKEIIGIINTKGELWDSFNKNIK